jgi:hypothetical protein
VCHECHAHLPSPRLMSLHVLETHDHHFLSLSSTTPSYRCLVLGCPFLSRTPSDRLAHLTSAHHWPPSFELLLHDSEHNTHSEHTTQSEHNTQSDYHSHSVTTRTGRFHRTMGTSVGVEREEVEEGDVRMREVREVQPQGLAFVPRSVALTRAKR